MCIPLRVFRAFLLPALSLLLLLPGIGRAGIATEVTVNKSVLLNLQKPSERVSIATPSIAELVLISPTQLQINGSKIGTTTLIVWEQGGKTSFFDISVKGDNALLENQIRELAPNDNIRVDYVNDTIVLSGKAANEQTIEKAVQIARAYAVKEDNGAGDKGIQLLPAYGNSNAKEADPKESEPKLKVLNHIQIDNPQQVLLEVKVAQVDKTALKSLGLSTFARGNTAEGFSNMVGAPSGELTIRDSNGNIKSQATGIAATMPGLAAINPLTPYQLGASLFKPGIGAVLKALVTKDLAKMLAEPNMLVKSGQEGDFLAGSKFYFPIVTNNTADIKEIRVGVKLKFKPVVMENGLIFLKIDPAEVSNISGFLPGNNLPIINTREIKSDVQLRDGESLVLAGLLQEETVKSISKMPFLGDIPILGALFRSTQDDLKEKEVVFFITPRIVKSNVPGTEPELPTDEPLTPEQEEEFKWIPLGK